MTAFVSILSFIYEKNAHQVYSDYMIWAFLYPLLGGVLVSLLVWDLKLRKRIPPLSICFYRAAILTATIGSLMKGAFDIYGTVLSKVVIYVYLTIILLILSLIFLFIRKKKDA